MRIHVEALTFDVIIGLLDFEREREQRVIIDLEILYDYSAETFINYADVAALIKKELQEKKYLLLEEALLGVKKELHTQYPSLKSLKLKISKPDILPDCNVALSQNWEF